MDIPSELGGLVAYMIKKNKAKAKQKNGIQVNYEVTNE